MEKLYKKIGWKNKPNLSTPLGATNMGKIDEALDGLDNRTIELDEQRANHKRLIDDLYVNVNEHTSAIEGLTEKSNDIDALKIISAASGSPAYIDDASNMNIENIVFYGESKQETTTGKNLFGFEKSAIDVTEELRKLDNQRLIFTKINDNSIKCNYSWGTYATGFVELNGVDGTKNYAFSFDVKDNKLGFTPRIEKYTQECTSEKLVLSIYSGSGATEVSGNEYFILENIQVEAGTTATPFEKYSGGKPAPNPDYPQMIEPSSVGSVRVYRKNLLNPSGFTTKTSNSVTFTPVFKDGLLQYINVNGTATADSYYAIIDKTNVPKEALVLNGCEGGSASTYSLLITYRNEDDTYADQAFQSQTDADLPIDASKKKYSVTIFVKSGATVNNARIYPMLRPTFFTDGTYEPYESQFASLTSSMYFLDGIGDLKNYIDLKRGVYVKKVESVVLDGSADEGWYTMDTQTAGVKRIYTRTFKVKNSASIYTPATNILCSHYKPISASDTYLQKQGIATTTADNYIYIYDERFNTADISLWKAHLASNPITLVYELETPTETKLSTEEMNDFKTFLNLHTYKPNTIVDAQDTLIDVQYVADTKAYIDKKFRELATVIVNQ